MKVLLQRANDLLIATFSSLQFNRAQTLRLLLSPLPSTNRRNINDNAVRKCHLHGWWNRKEKYSSNDAVLLLFHKRELAALIKPAVSNPNCSLTEMSPSCDSSELASEPALNICLHYKNQREIIGAVWGSVSQRLEKHLPASTPPKGPLSETGPWSFWKRLARGHCRGWCHYFYGVLMVPPQHF